VRLDPTNIQQTGNEPATQSNDATESFFGTQQR